MLVTSTSVVFPAQNTMPLPHKPMDNVSLSPPLIRVFDKKRKDTPTVDGSTVAKKPRGRPPGKKNKVQGIQLFNVYVKYMSSIIFFNLSSFLGINTLLLSPNNKVDFGSNSATIQPLIGNCAHGGSDISLPTQISPVATCIGEANATSYNVISSNRVMVEPVKQMVYKEDYHVISPIEAHSDQTNMGNTNTTSTRDTNKTSTRALDKSSLNEIPTSESDKDKDNWAHLDFSSIGLDDGLKIDFSKFEVDDSFTEMLRDIEIPNQEFFDSPT